MFTQSEVINDLCKFYTSEKEKKKDLQKKTKLQRAETSNLGCDRWFPPVTKNLILASKLGEPRKAEFVIG